jgi:hypothetical protein
MNICYQKRSARKTKSEIITPCMGKQAGTETLSERPGQSSVSRSMRSVARIRFGDDLPFPAHHLHFILHGAAWP